MLGAFAAAAVVYWEYKPQFDIADPMRTHTAGIFATFPLFPNIPSAGLYDQILGTALLMIIIFAVTDQRNLAPSGNVAPILVGLSVVAIGMSFGSLHGYAINPARDFGPRLLTVFAGFKNNGLTDGTKRILGAYCRAADRGAARRTDLRYGNWAMAEEIERGGDSC